MLIKKYILFFSFLALVSSCNKSSVKTDETIAAKTMLNVPYGSDPSEQMDIYLPANRTQTTTKAMIMVHGGAWSLQDKADFNQFVDTIRNRMPDYAIFNINYRLSAYPKNLFPTQELDTKAAVEFVYGNRSNYLVSDKFVMLGASAGAHLSLLQAYKYTGPVKIKAVVDFFGPTDMFDLYNNPGIVPAISIATIVGATPASNPLIYTQSSPINFVTNQSCPTIILQGGMDLLVNHVTQSEVLKAKLVTAGVINQYVYYPLADHGNWDNATFKDAFNNIQAFLAAHVL